ncbi:unnamed protein product, partial [Symbiodinium sp. KB8]
ERVRQRLVERLLVNFSRSECKKQGIPYYRDEKFCDPVIGPNMHQVNAGFIRPTTEQNDPFHGISRLSYALHCNPYGLKCDLFISHAWAEGVFELTGTVLENWPKDCEAAYICALANPQNLPNFLRALIQNPLSSPFFQVLLRQPKQMLMVANANVPIHSRLWCVFEAHCARHLAVHTAVVGDPAHFATNAGASKSAKRAIRRAVEARRREAAINEAAEQAASDMDIIAAGIYSRRYDRWSKRAQQSTHKATQSMKRALDVRLASCSSTEDADAIWRFISGHADEINAMICELIIRDQLSRTPSGPYKLTWYPGQDAIEGEHASLFSVEAGDYSQVPEGQGKPDKQAKGNLQPGKPAVKVAFRYNPPAEAALVFGGVSLDHLNGIGQWITCKAKGVLGGGFVPPGETPTQELTVELRAYLQQI